jgi:hypothetical protein
VRTAGSAEVFFSLFNLLKRFIMKLFVVFVSLLSIGFSVSAYAKPVEIPASSVVMEELPWSTVDAVLRRAAELYHTYSYSQLVEWYSDAVLTVEEGGSGYLVTIIDEDGIADVLDIAIL